MTWRNADGGIWQQWHDDDDPMPTEWDDRPPDEVVHVYTAAQVADMLAAERERCAAWVDARRDAFCEEHGSIDPDTGTLEFGRGAHAEAKSEYVGELEEIAAGLRALPGA